MEVFFVAGRADDPAYAHAELLADKLARVLPRISIVKYPKLPDEWASFLEDTCRSKGFLAYYRSPLIWSSSERLVGDEKEFAALAREQYNIELDPATTDLELLKKIAEENLEECLRERGLETTPKAKLYVSPVSAACFGPWLLLIQSNTLFEAVQVDLMRGEHLSTDYVSLNPQHTVPTLVDKNGTVVWESNAIMRYLMGAYNLPDRFLPTDVTAHAIVDQSLDFRQTILYPAISAIAYPVFGWKSAPPSPSEAEKTLFAAFDVLEKQLLRGTLFIGSDEPTIGDFATVPLIHLLSATSFQLPPRIREYVKRFEREVPSYLTLLDKGLNQMIAHYAPKAQE